MLKLNMNTNIFLKDEDQNIIKAIEKSIFIMEDENLLCLWNDIKKCKFENHIIGKGGNHIFITRKIDDVRIVTITEELDPQLKFNYMMLGRLKSDCEYYLNYGNRNKKALWALDEKEQIEEMKKLYNGFADTQKPEWLSYEDILNYEKEMIE